MDMRRLIAPCLLLCAAALSAPLRAQGLPYRVQVEAPRPLADLLEANLDLMRWRGNPRLDRDQLARLVRLAPEQVRTLVATEGYYAPEVSASVDIEAAEPLVTLRVQPGEPVRVSEVALHVEGVAPDLEADLRAQWALHSGQVFRQADWEAAKRKLLRQAMQRRYPRAQLGDTSATVDPAAHTARLQVTLVAGAPVRLGELRIEGLQRYPASVISNLSPLHVGDEYSEAALQTFQARLQDAGYFNGVEVSADLASEGDIVPVLVRVSENKVKNVAVGLGYSTNTGNRATANFDDLNVRGLRLKSAVTLETRRQATHADFFLPTSPDGYNDSFGASFERNDLNGEITSVSNFAVKRGWGSPALERSLSFEYLNERKTIDGKPRAISQSLPLTWTLTKRQLDSLLFPTEGYVLQLMLGGALLPILTERPFVRGAAKGIWYRPLSPAATLILRGEAAALASRQKAGVPATYLFRAGGDGSVRGYGYQQLGVRDGTAIVGGRYLLVGSAEYQYWFDPPWGMAVFYDAGNAGDVYKELKPRAGYGVGLRWKSPVGPINVDAAYGQAIHKYRFHFSLGFTF
ncbi:autotransporter assembly complex family protein [Massilia sp. TS11]|uniref:autotransporter assembly complex protein TamA n=1 Tax=Massilia sp. TS11 TaxID=2908003 RepID=UPI001ED9F622|nr:autotransporter assembly complex family protein [Massilia sp. TS11]MCG2585036.1 autotransporter assembly complex protein TamA [Massilia sp. TS11]